MRIGISILIPEGRSVGHCALSQNVILLAGLFSRLPFVESVVLIDLGTVGAASVQTDLDGQTLPMLTAREAADHVDVVIEMGGEFEASWLALMRARGKKVVRYYRDQPYLRLVESSIFDKPCDVPRADSYDEIWLPAEDAWVEPLMKTLYRCEVYRTPFIWHPHFVEQRAREVVALGLQYGYQGRAAATGNSPMGLRVAIAEQNGSVTSASPIAMLVCDEAWRTDRNTMSAMHVLNTLHMKDHPTMLYFANSLDLTRQHRAIFHGSNDIVEFMARHADAVVSHQWRNGLNYRWLEVLHGDYPLIHNSPWLKAGYYYPHFDVLEGAVQLRDAAANHERALGDYRGRSRLVFDAVDPFKPHNLDAYAARLLHLRQDTAFRHASGACP